MTSRVYIYLSGSIKKGKADTRDSFWTETDQELIRTALAPMLTAFLNPAVRDDDVTDAVSTYGHDLLQVYCADAVMVDARDRRGIGVGAEMTFAKLHGIPLVAIVRRNSYYFQDELEYLGQRVSPFIHPFVAGPSDFVAESVADAARWVRDIVNAPESRIKNSETFLDAIKRYVHHSLTRDTPMRDHVTTDTRLRSKIEQLIGRPIAGESLS
jgi:hypothetical protein